MKNWFKGIFNKYLDYEIVGDYLEWNDGKFVKKYIIGGYFYPTQRNLKG